MSVEVLKAVYNKLVSQTGDPAAYNSFHIALGGRIYATIAPPDTVFPFCVFEMSAPDVEHFFGNLKRLTATLDVHVFDKTDKGVDSLMDIETLLFDLLDDTDLATTGFDRSRVRTLSRGSVNFDSEEVYGFNSTFEIIATG